GRRAGGGRGHGRGDRAGGRRGRRPRGRRGGGGRIAPLRTCIGCRRTAPPGELERVVRRPDGTLTIGRGLPGRGAWLCAGSLSCVDLAARKRAFSRALRAEITPEAVTGLRAAVAERARMKGCATTGRATGTGTE